MTFVKFNQAPAVKSFNGLVEDIFNNAGFNRFLKDDVHTNDFYGAHPPVNITETKEGYQVDLLVPGFSKEDIKINLDNKVLTISAEKAPEQKDENQKQLRREFSFRSFKRSFTVNEQVDAEKIQAKYENGVLRLQLAKKEKVEDAAKAIVVE